MPDLVSLIAQGDESAFTQFVRSWGPEIQQAIQQVVGSDPDIVRDLTQDIFLQLWIAREKLGTVTDPGSWIFRVVY